MLKQIRKQKGYTQVEIAKKANVSIRHYQGIESMASKPTVYIAQRIATALNTTVENLFSVNNENTITDEKNQTIKEDKKMKTLEQMVEQYGDLKNKTDFETTKNELLILYVEVDKLEVNTFYQKYLSRQLKIDILGAVQNLLLSQIIKE